MTALSAWYHGRVTTGTRAGAPAASGGAHSVFSAAEHLLHADGPHALSVRHIAELAGTSTQAVYTEFGGKAGYDSKQAALYWPWVKVFDPASGQNQFVPPSGHMAGVWARTDSTRASAGRGSLITRHCPLWPVWSSHGHALSEGRHPSHLYL